ncbi:MAG: acyl-CoA dehydrogenase family protein [Myxococcota bacterium]|nr:acyl-CoA dehydrogenase family protein [Myxococcota bacterium]
MQPNPPLPEFARGFQDWLAENAAALAHLKQLPRLYDDRIAPLRELQAALFDAGWARVGWSQALGGLGGSALHRAALIDILQENGYPPRHLFEHLEILPPALEQFAGSKLIEQVFLPSLRGDVLWCQGFSEPTAGSDLAALKTTATRVEGGYRLDGHKIWTSWAKWATHLLLLARTGTPEDRHRGLSAFVIRTDAPGVEVGPIRQANSHDELAEVFLDGAVVADDQRIGDEGQGWAVAMKILAGERGSYAWLRQCEMLPRLERLAGTPGAEAHAGVLGGSLVDLLALRARSRAVLEIIADGGAPGPESSVSKVLVIDTEQHFYETAREVLSPGLDLGTADDVLRWQDQYLYSRASSVYGGSREIQLNVIAKLLVSRGGAEIDEDEERATVRESIGEAIEQSDDGNQALDGLDWWTYAAAPEDELGRAAFAAWFEEQGRTLVTSSALAAVRSAAAADALAAEPGEVAVVVREQDDAVLVYGVGERTKWLVSPSTDRAARARGEVRVREAAGLVPRASQAFDASFVEGFETPAGAERALTLDAAADARAESLARIAAAHEILGAARALLILAIEHANERQQFGQPIAGFQAIQHLLSESQVDVSALAELCRAALEEWSAGDASELAKAAKALAGRAGLAVAQRALQCFGAIGFTDEHDHHRYSRRIHTLDAILGSHYALRRELGAALVESGHAPRGLRVWRSV